MHLGDILGGNDSLWMCKTMVRILTISRYDAVCCDAIRYSVPMVEVFSFANRMLRVYEGLQSEASLCRLMTTITLLQLEGGDVVAVSVHGGGLQEMCLSIYGWCIGLCVHIWKVQKVCVYKYMCIRTA